MTDRELTLVCGARLRPNRGGDIAVDLTAPEGMHDRAIARLVGAGRKT